MAFRTKLDEFSRPFFERNVARNKFSEIEQYSENHPDALSDGDELGKGEFNGSIGGRTDILTREKNTARNFYSPKNQYSLD